MTRRSAVSVFLVNALVALFAVAGITYGSVWMYYTWLQTASAEMGFQHEYSQSARAVVVRSVQPGSPAAQGGLQPFDRIVEVNARQMDTPERFDAWDHERPEGAVTFTIERPGVSSRLLVTGRFPSRSSTLSLGPQVRRSILGLLGAYPIVFLAVGLTVLAMRPGDPHAWLLAILFSGSVAAPVLPRSISQLPAPVHSFVFLYRAIFIGLLPAVFYTFFAVFPTRSPLDRRLPWLRWIAIAFSFVTMVPGLRSGSRRAPDVVIRWLGPEMSANLLVAITFGFMTLGIVSLALNAVSARTPDARRKTRVLLWGTLVGVVPILVEQALEVFANVHPPYWVYPATVLISFVFPLSFAYAVVKHRVLDIPVLLKRSARYVLVRRGFYVLIVLLGVTATAVFTLSFSRLVEVDVNVATAVGVAFGIVLAVSSAPILRQTTTRIDRAFFRSAYDARAILESLAERIRKATSREALAGLLERQIREALHPITMVVYVEHPDGRLHPLAVHGAEHLGPLPPDRSWLRELADYGRPWNVPLNSGEHIPPELRTLRAECLVPILGREGQLTGALVLGPRVSEEPYSGEDKRLLATAASQAGVELENLRLAEGMAERLDAERAAARELEIARQVQFRLFPQKQPVLETLDYAGGCLQARQVGGDYYDFVDLGRGRVGLVLADISGKGMAGALLMANLQANLRGQYAIASDDLPRLLRSVNQLFYDNTAENQYATLVFADYTDATRRLRYANCGHFPPLLVRATGAVDELMPTATVLGLFEEWDTPTCDVFLHPGDVVVMYTDGVLEAANEQDEQFGSERLLDTIRAHRHEPAASIVSAVHAAVQAFSAGAPSDDLTVVVAKVREN